jgi:eukaryotic-like serine/threonine-protein kinase
MAVDRDHRPANCREFVEDLTGHSTRKITPSGEVKVQDVWYLVYTDDDNVTRTVKGTLQGIRRSLRDGVLGDASNIRAARTKSGPFESLRNHPQFRDLVLALPVTPPAGSGRPELKALPQRPSGVASAAKSQPPAPRAAPPGAPAVEAAPKPAPASGEVPLAPLINLGPTDAAFDWLKWTAVLFGVAGLAAIGYFLVPLLMR